jgi:hypothetical protein
MFASGFSLASNSFIAYKMGAKCIHEKICEFRVSLQNPNTLKVTFYLTLKRSELSKMLGKFCHFFVSSKRSKGSN